MCRSRRELSNEYLLAKIGVDTAENEHLEVWGENSIHYSFASLVSTAFHLAGGCGVGGSAETLEGPFSTVDKRRLL